LVLDTVAVEQALLQTENQVVLEHTIIHMQLHILLVVEVVGVINQHQHHKLLDTVTVAMVQMDIAEMVVAE
jgi:hypothetical protein